MKMVQEFRQVETEAMKQRKGLYRFWYFRELMRAFYGLRETPFAVTQNQQEFDVFLRIFGFTIVQEHSVIAHPTASNTGIINKSEWKIYWYPSFYKDRRNLR
jgi:hypothetical protein